MKFLVVTGLSGSGKSGAVNVLEDIGYYCIDNIPPQLIPKFADICIQGHIDRVAVVTDIRGIAAETSEGETFRELRAGIEYLKKTGNMVNVLFLQADKETLIKRYKETRRRHPLDERAAGSIENAVEMETEIMSEIREAADFCIDTTDMNLSRLRDRITDLFMDNPEDSMSVNVMSFGFKYGMNREADLVFDVRCLPNPFYIPELKNHTGLEDCVRDYVMSFEQSRELEKRLIDLLDFLMPLYRKEGKTLLSIAFGCTGGRHRSVTFAENIYRYLKSKGIKARVTHRELDTAGG